MKKKSLFFIAMTVALATVVNLFAGIVVFANDATPSDVVEIDTVEELKAVKDNLAGNYKLTANIDLNGEEWTPIGSIVNDDKTGAFTGTFDGNGKTVSNFILTTANNDEGGVLYGFFASVDGGTIKNLKIAKATYIADSKTSDPNEEYTGNVTAMGAVVGRLYSGVISGCETATDVTITVTKGYKNHRVGGIVGYINGTVEYCVNRATVTSSATNNYYNGGVVGGIANGNISYCVNYGTVECTVKAKKGCAWIGGICGQLDNWQDPVSTVEYCVNFGTVTNYDVDSNSAVGGITGECKGSNKKYLNNCFNLGEISTNAVPAQIIGWASKTPTGATNNYGLNVDGAKIAGNTDTTVGTTLTTKEAILENATYKAILAEVDEHLTGISTDLYGYQTTAVNGGKFDMRLVATLSGDYSKLANVGFKVEATYTGLDGKKETVETVTKLYNSITATNAGAETATEHTAASLGGDYIFVLACKGIPADAENLTFTVTTFYTATGAQSSVYSEVETFVVEVSNDTLPTA